MPTQTITIIGEQAMRRRLLSMSASVQGAIMRPIVADAARIIQETAQALAPHRTGALRRGIEARILRFGAGYCKAVVQLTPEVYYGKFQEFGLGSGTGKSPSATVQRRRGNYANSMRVRRQVQIAMAKGGLSFEEATAGMGKRERKRQKILEKGGYLQGKRKPNMLAKPFLRPAVKQWRIALRMRMLDALWDAIKRWSA